MAAPNAVGPSDLIAARDRVDDYIMDNFTRVITRDLVPGQTYLAISHVSLDPDILSSRIYSVNIFRYTETEERVPATFDQGGGPIQRQYTQPLHLYVMGHVINTSGEERDASFLSVESYRINPTEVAWAFYELPEDSNMLIGELMERINRVRELVSSLPLHYRPRRMPVVRNFQGGKRRTKRTKRTKRSKRKSRHRRR